jgi:hypothetical protein
MILPGVVALAFYKRRPTALEVALGLVFTVVLSAVLGYISPAGPLTRFGSVVIAIIGGVVIYVAILAYLIYSYQPRHAPAAVAEPPRA